jgi:AmmeMemoRadiSam system protein B
VRVTVKYVTVCVFCSYKDQFTIVPILVGTLSQDRQLRYGRLLLKYLKDPQNLFIISSDFCHWGSQFRYTYYDTSYTYVYESIEHVDRTVRIMIARLLTLNCGFVSGDERNRKFEPCRIYRLSEKVRKHDLRSPRDRNSA